MQILRGLFVEDEEENVRIYTALFETVGLNLVCVDEFPESLEQYYDIVLEKEIDFLIIDYHLDKEVSYKGIDVLKEIRKNDRTIYAVLLTNYQLDDFSEGLSAYDYEVKKRDIANSYRAVAEKIKRACALRQENFIVESMWRDEKENAETIELLKEISLKLDLKSNDG